MTNTSPQHNNEELILGILNDAIIFNRLCDKLYHALKIDSNWCPAEGNYKGIGSAYKILNIEDSSTLKDDLQNIFSQYAESNIDLIPATKKIYSEWQNVINQ